MQQLTFADLPLARRSDPATSHAAADASAGLRHEHEARILEALKLGPAGKDLIADRANLTGVQVARRMAKLQKLKLIAPTGRTVPSTSGRLEREWAIA
jgi:hypothetical protein